MSFPPLTSAASEAIDRVHAHQLSKGQASTELLICLSGDGRHVIDEASGGVDRVQLTDKMIAAAVSGSGCRLVHNHPQEGSLSAADWRLAAAQTGILEIVAVNSRRSVFRGRLLQPVPNGMEKAVAGPDLSAQVADELAAPLWAGFNQALKEGRELISPDIALGPVRWVWSHLLNQRLKNLGFIEYEAALATGDQACLTDAKYVDLISAAQARLISLVA